MTHTGLSEVNPEILGHEHPAEKDPEKPVSRRSADCVLRIGNRIFHLEVQSTDDGTILFRLVEYDLRIAMEQAEYNRKANSLTIELPLSGLLYLRRGKLPGMKLDSMWVILQKMGRSWPDTEFRL